MDIIQMNTIQIDSIQIDIWTVDKWTVDKLKGGQIQMQAKGQWTNGHGDKWTVDKQICEQRTKVQYQIDMWTHRQKYYWKEDVDKSTMEKQIFGQMASGQMDMWTYCQVDR